MASSPLDSLNEFPSRVKKLTLQNGARVLMVERPHIPTVSFAIFIRTGGLDDEHDKSGLAHMFEHMLFKGTKTIGTTDYSKEKIVLSEIDKAAARLQKAIDRSTSPVSEAIALQQEKLKELQKEHEAYLVEEEFWKVYERAGGRGLNAGTGFDFTNYVVSLPANQIKLWMVMESSRIKGPVLREFYKERDVVLEELRLRVDNSPKGKLWQAFLAAAFVAHPYGRPIIGWKHEISRLTRKDAEDFFRKHYDISRMVFVLVGGFDSEMASKQMKKYFGSIPSQLVDVPDIGAIEPEQEGERRVEVEYDAEPSLLIGYHRPRFDHPDNPALEMLADILSTGRTSRFHKNIIKKKKIAVSAWAGSSTPGERDPCLFVLGGSPRAPHTTQDLEKSFYEEIERIQQDGPTEEELQKVKNFVVDYMVRQLSSNAGLAHHLGYYEALSGDWEFIFNLIRDIQRVTPEEVRGVANTYLIKSNRTVAMLVKKEKP